MLKLLRVTSNHSDFIELVKHLDLDLARRDGDMTEWFAQFNKVPNLETVVLAYQGEEPVGCGAFKKFDERTVEVKRMFVFEHKRGHGIASKVLAELESWAKELGYQRCVLETGVKQPEAIRLYEKNHYARISNFPPYVGQDLSVCFEKLLD